MDNREVVKKMCEKIYWDLTDKLGNDIEKIKKDEMQKYIQKYWIDNVNYNTARGYLVYINYLLNSKGLDYGFSIGDFEVSTSVKGTVLYEDLMSALKKEKEEFGYMSNAQDRFLILAMFNGILGKQACELINLKKEDVLLDCIKVGDRKVVMDDTFKEVTIQAINQEEYFVIKEERVNSFNINTNSKYIFTPKPSKKTNEGLDTLGYAGLRTRFYNMIDRLGINLTMDGLVKSGYVYKMHLENVGQTYPEVENWIEKNEVKVCPYGMLKLYKEFYN